MFTATLQFNTRQKAKDFARLWSFWSKRGHTLSASAPDGKTSLILDKVTPTDRQWINNQIAMINAKEEQAAKQAA
jgi:hypothetical protein